MKGFTVQLATRWAKISRVKLKVDYLSGIDNEWADALSRKKDSIKGFFQPEQRIEFSVNDLLSLRHQPMRVPQHERWPDQLRKLMSAEICTPWFLPAAAPSPNAGGKDGEHAQAAVVYAARTELPLLESTLSTAGLHHRQQKMHRALSPSFVNRATVIRDVLNMVRGWLSGVLIVGIGNFRCWLHLHCLEVPRESRRQTVFR